MADETKPTPEKVALNLSELIPEEYATRFAAGEFTDNETARKALQETYKNVLSKQGFGDVKTTQTGTHKAVQNKLKGVADKVGFTIDLTDQSKTEDVIDQLEMQITELKKAAPKAGLSEQEKQELADLQQLKKALEKTNLDLENERKKVTEVLTKAEQEKENIIKSLQADKVLGEALEATKKARIEAISNSLIMTAFNAKYTVDVIMKDGKPNGYELREKNGNIAMKNANDTLKINDALLLIYKENGVELKQPTQASPVLKGTNPSSIIGNSKNPFIGFNSKQ